MKKALSLLFLGLILTGYCFSQTVSNPTVTIEITNVVINNGKIYLHVFSTAENYKNGKPDFTFVLEADNSILSQELTIPDGEYLLSAYQDTNNNQKLDTGLFGIPKELVGLSNYFGKGYPSKYFDPHKILVNNSTERITIGLYKF